MVIGFFLCLLLVGIVLYQVYHQETKKDSFGGKFGGFLIFVCAAALLMLGSHPWLRGHGGDAIWLKVSEKLVEWEQGSRLNVGPLPTPAPATTANGVVQTQATTPAATPTGTTTAPAAVLAPPTLALVKWDPGTRKLTLLYPPQSGTQWNVEFDGQSVTTLPEKPAPDPYILDVPTGVTKVRLYFQKSDGSIGSAHIIHDLPQK